MRNKLSEWKMNVDHGQPFYAMLVDVLKQVFEQSRKIRYTKSQVDTVELRRRQTEALDYIESVVQWSPNLGEVDWRKLRPPNELSANHEMSDILAVSWLDNFSSRF